MKRIALSNTRFGGEPLGFALVDDEDYELVSRYSWSLAVRGAISYAQGPIGRGRSVYMHRLLLSLQLGDRRVVDHRNGDGLDNRRANLRAITTAENMRNRRPRLRQVGSSAFRGVSWFPLRDKWRATATVNGKQRSLGYFHDELEAARAVEAFWRDFEPSSLDAACAARAA
jgi:hypothetical protein